MSDTWPPRTSSAAGGPTPDQPQPGQPEQPWWHPSAPQQTGQHPAPSGQTQPGYGQPRYGQPGYGQPRYGQPGYGQPGHGRFVDGYGPDHSGHAPGFGPDQTPGFDPRRPIGSSGDPHRPIATGRDSRSTLQAPPKPPQSRLPVILVSAVIAVALIGLVFGAVASVRADIAARTPPSVAPQPSETAVPRPANQARFETRECRAGELEVLDHQRTTTEVLVQIRIACQDGREPISADQFAMFDKDTLDYYNDPPLDRPAVGYDTAEPGHEVIGWVRFLGVPEGTMTLLMLDPRQNRTAAAISIRS